ncbi:uncharacterized protein DSM5745_01288 [Aspergillus mulundensis]|uniref:Uncharacterized protein n=1 Tax=Aspergillus mulundensis TaxID=1810919 RepID=A0A3D8T5X1_9EURO|nr:hypothetical protein DSM5745_01288 [Aspergillus mulundensis]RDW93966.1 hypothetical protein DSM5745_01288 [Aspergillus mulundensis]
MDRYLRDPHRGRYSSSVVSSPDRTSSARDRSLSASSSLTSFGSVTIAATNNGDQQKIELNVIAIPGYNSPPADTWDIELAFKKAAVAAGTVSAFHQHAFQADDESMEDFTWKAYIGRGGQLMEGIRKLATMYPDMPIICVAHSLGGVLLKQALLTAHRNDQDEENSQAISRLAGILFLGTPHGNGLEDYDIFKRHENVRSIHDKRRFALLPSKPRRSDVSRVAAITAQFEQIATVPLLSVHEAETRSSGLMAFVKSNRVRHLTFLKGPRADSSRAKAVVDRELASIHSSTERLLGVPVNHDELCQLSNLKNDSYSAEEFLRSLLHDLGGNKRWTSERRRPTGNPVNPLNLPPVQLSQIPVRSLGGDDGQAPRSRLRDLGLTTSHNLSGGSSTNSLLDGRHSELPCFHLPLEPNASFIKRDGLFAAMDSHLLPVESEKRHQPRLYAVCGMGGVGKSELVREYAHSRRSKFGAVFWIDADRVSQLASSFGHIAELLGLLRDNEAQSPDLSKRVAMAWLSRPRSASAKDNWLLIFDNATEPDLLADYLPYNGNGSILITSRDPFAKEDFFANASGIELEPLSTDDSATLLQRMVTGSGQAQTGDERDASEELAKRWGGLPLALTQMAGFMRRRQISMREFLRLYDTDARYADFHAVGNPLQDWRYGQTLSTTFTLERLTPCAWDLLCQLAFMHPGRVPEYLFVGVKGSERPGGTHWDDADFADARSELLTSALIRRNKDTGSLWIHRVIQKAVRTRLQDERIRHAAFQKAVALMSATWPPGDHTSQEIKRWSTCEELLPHLTQFYQLYSEHSDQWQHFDVQPDFLMLLHEAALYFHERGNSHEGKAYVKLALDLSEKSNITTEPLISDMHLTIGALANETNDGPTCLKHTIQCLSIREKESSRRNAPDLRLAFAHSQMGIAYMMNGMFARATDRFQQSVKMLKAINADADELGFPACNLGLAYWVQENLSDADSTLTELLVKREALHGRLDRVSYQTGRVLHALGNVRSSKALMFESQGDHDAAKALWDDAFNLHRNCLTQYESTLGKFTHRTADACHKVAEHYIRLGQDSDAKKMLERALDIWGDRPWYRNESARSSFLLGTHLVSLGGDDNVKNGNIWLKRAKELRRQIRPDAEDKELVMEDFDELHLNRNVGNASAGERAQRAVKLEPTWASGAIARSSPSARGPGEGEGRETRELATRDPDVQGPEVILPSYPSQHRAWRCRAIQACFLIRDPCAVADCPTLEEAFSPSVRPRQQSSQPTVNQLYSRPDLNNLRSYLNGNAVGRPESPPGCGEANAEIFAVSHTIATGTSTLFEASLDGRREFEASGAPDTPTILFLRGFPSPEWLNVISRTHQASSELYHRHLDCLIAQIRRDYFSKPPIPSSSARVFQLMIPTICSRHTDDAIHASDARIGEPEDIIAEPESLREERQLQARSMRNYITELPKNAKVADSVVRKYHILSREFSVLEQMISVDVSPPGSDWRAIVWLDTGRDLADSFEGPFGPRPGSPAWQTFFYPVIVHHADGMHDGTPYGATQGPSDAPSSSRACPEPLTDEQKRWKAAQNISRLPFEYGSRLNRRFASHDALYALSEIFQFAATAQSQYLNFLETRIELELSTVGTESGVKNHSVSLVNLQYVKALLTSFAQNVAETVNLLQNRDFLHWSRAEDTTGTDRVANMLRADFQHLQQRAKTLRRECDQGMATLANSSSLDETRRSAQIAFSVKGLTIIGTIFIPLSFVCSVWGMNVKELGSGNRSIWMWVATALPVAFLTYVAYWFRDAHSRQRERASGRRSLRPGRHTQEDTVEP